MSRHLHESSGPSGLANTKGSRALTDDVVLIGEGVCAQHARLTVRDGLVRIEDLDTKTGTIVNGERIPASFPVALYPGDTIQLGGLALRLVQGAAG